MDSREIRKIEALKEEYNRTGDEALKERICALASGRCDICRLCEGWYDLHYRWPSRR